MENLEELFQQTKKYPNSGQYLLDQIDLGEYSQYVNKLTYIKKERLVSNREYKIEYLDIDDQIVNPGHMVCLLTTKFKLDQNKAIGLKSDILVFHYALRSKNYVNFHDFYNALKYHEGFHAKETYEREFTGEKRGILHGREELENDLEKAHKEYRATNNQIINFSENNTEKFKQSTLKWMKHWTKEISRLERELGLKSSL